MQLFAIKTESKQRKKFLVVEKKKKWEKMIFLRYADTREMQFHYIYQSVFSDSDTNNPDRREKDQYRR